MMLELSSDKLALYQDLFKKAEATQDNAYSPYSTFKVGAALLTKDNRIFIGVNVENASYGLTICAERSAIFSAISQGVAPSEIEAIAVSANGDRFSPCGACRQVIFEFGADIVVIFRYDGNIVINTVDHLLPYSFKV